MIQQHDGITRQVRDEASFGLVERAGERYGWQEFATDCGYSIDAPGMSPAGSTQRIEPGQYTTEAFATQTRVIRGH